MKLPVIRKLAGENDLATIEEAARAFEENRQNPLQVSGDDEGEILTNLLMAAEVRKKMDQEGISLQEAIRAHAQRVQRVIGS